MSELPALPSIPTLRTERTVLRPWRPDDREPFAAMNADPVVMEHFPTTLTRVESDTFADHIVAGMNARGWGLSALEISGELSFAGFVGLNVVSFELPSELELVQTPPVEIGWRLATTAWGRGLATEAAGVALSFGFDQLGLTEIISFTTVGNHRSQRVMQKLGMRSGPDDVFDHPRMLELGHLDHARHVLYRITRAVRP